MFKERTQNNGRDIDKKWKMIFDDYDVLNVIDKAERFEITAKEIRDYKEARLMTKFDYVNSLPDLFYNNGLSILPTTRGNYLIGRFKAYEFISNKDSDFSSNIYETSFPSWIETLNYTDITSESIMLNASSISGMIHHLFNVNDVFQTISGRMGSEIFSFKINDTRNNNSSHLIKVNKSQLEIDAGFETEDSLILVEAKNNTTDSFLIRQLYYPYRLWSNRVSKPVIPVYLQYENGIYNFSVFRFNELNNYNSLELVKRQNYIITDESIYLKDIQNILEDNQIVEEPNYKIVPFPQADDFDKIIHLLETLYDSSLENSTDEFLKESKGFLTLEELTLMNDFTYRQAHYYSRAALYLKLVRIEGQEVHLSMLGQKIMSKSARAKKLSLIGVLLSHKPFNLIMKYMLDYPNLTTKDIKDILIENELLINSYGEGTILRRSQTIKSWLNTILSMTRI